MRITDFEILDSIKNEYTKLRQDGASRDTAVQTLVLRYHDELTFGAKDDGLLFWVGLADVQYSLKELSSEIAAKGFAALIKLTDNIPEITPGDIAKRRERYSCAPMPERKEICKPKRFRCQWRIGDTFAYQLSGPHAQKDGIDGNYILLRKVDEMELSDGRLLPIVTLTHWNNTTLPSNEQEFQTVPLLKLSNGRLCAPQSTYEYRIEILFSRAKQIAQLGLKYLGNFQDVPMPHNEFFYKAPGYTLMILPERFDQALSYYCGLQAFYEERTL